MSAPHVVYFYGYISASSSLLRSLNVALTFGYDPNVSFTSYPRFINSTPIRCVTPLKTDQGKARKHREEMLRYG